MTTKSDAYNTDIAAVIAHYEAKGDEVRAECWRKGAADFNAGLTSYHGWACARRILAGEPAIGDE